MLNVKMNNFINKDILEYSEKYSQQEPEILQELNRETHLKILNPRMLSGFFQGRLLSIISKLIKPKKVLEIGTYTGYSAICIAEGMNKNGIIHTIDKNEELNTIQKKYFKKSGLENNIIQYNGCALDIIPKIEKKFDLIFIDADKENYKNYFDLSIKLLHKNGYIIIDNVLWHGDVANRNKNDKFTNIIREFNSFVKDDIRVEKIILPIGDGITICKKV